MPVTGCQQKIMLTRKNKKKVRQISFILMLTAFLLSMGIILFKWLSPSKTRFVRYPEFGITIPENYAIHGIDVSKYQQQIDWDEVKRMRVKNVQIGFSFIKATEGTQKKDPEFKRNWKKSRLAGIHRGAYHFFIASKDGTQQARYFIKHVELESGDLPPVLDVEQLNGAGPMQLRTEVKEWLQEVERHYGVKPIIYTNVDFYHRYLGEAFDAYPLWVAHYYREKDPSIKREWLFWQHSDRGRVNGINHLVDFNVFNGDSVQLKKLLIP